MEDFKKVAGNSKKQLFFCGGHGGFVRCDGEGKQMKKNGGPIDRLFVFDPLNLEPKQRAFDVHHGGLDFQTGKLSGKVINESEGVFLANFSGNDDAEAIHVTGCIPEMGIPHGSTLFKGTVEPSQMRLVFDEDKSMPSLPYSATHLKFEVNKNILEYLGIKSLGNAVALSGWDKRTTGIALDSLNETGLKFSTHQHLGTLHIYFQ